VYFCDEVTVHIWIQLLQQVAGVFRPVPSKMLLLKKEVHTQICFTDYRGVLDSEIANTRQDEVFESLDTNDAGSGVDQEDV
jgi:hypothetical protein